MKTYNEILNAMKTAYFEKCGENVAPFSDTAARLEAAASELFSLSCKGEYILKQAFPQSAEGEYLDFHARLRDITRKEKSFAEGELTFYVNEAAPGDIEIPAGTLCSKENEPFIQFETTENATLSAGETAVTAPARAVDGGWEYNAPSGTVTTMVNAPAGLDGVSNSEAFSGGFDAENDDALRERILNSYSIPQTAFSLDSIREALMKKSEITDCKVYYSDGEISVFVRLKTGADFEEISYEIESDIALSLLIDCTVAVTEAQPEAFSLTVEVKTDGEDVEEKVKKAAASFVSSSGINEDININRLVYALSKVAGVRYCEVSSPSAVQGLILCPDGCYLSLGGIAVNCYE